jgi:hypothetical protein
MAETQLALADKCDTKPKRLTRWQSKFIAALKQAPHVGLAAKAAGISRETAYKHRRDNPLFAAAWASVLDDSIDDLEVKAFQEALGGNVPLIQFLLKAHRRNIYGDVSRHEHALLGKILILPAKAEGDE